MGLDQGLVYNEPIISTLNAGLCASLPSISPCLTAVEVTAMSTSPHNNNDILLRRLAFISSLLRYVFFVIMPCIFVYSTLRCGTLHQFQLTSHWFAGRVMHVVYFTHGQDFTSWLGRAVGCC